jgi:hypothetical protein
MCDRVLAADVYDTRQYQCDVRSEDIARMIGRTVTMQC